MPGDLEELEKKLAAFRQEEDVSEKKHTGDSESQQEKDAQNLRMGLRAGSELVIGLAAGILIGWFLDKWLGTLPLFLIIFTFSGIGAGFLNIYRITQNISTPTGVTELHNRQKQGTKTPENGE